MKRIILVVSLLFSLSAFGYGYGFGLSSDLNSLSNKLDDIQRKQRCIAKNQREQAEYSECLARCQRDQDFNNSLGMSSLNIGCFCSAPFTSYCY